MIFGLDGAWATVLGQSTSSYSAVLTLGLLVASGILLGYARRVACAGRVADVVIAGFAAGLVGARLEHVLLNWNYFQTAPSEVLQFMQGGLDWHGALLGAVMSGALIARLRGVQMKTLAPALMIVLPFMAFAGWWACAAASCAYGAEVENLADWPSFLVWEARGDLGMIAPRFQTQLMGMLSSVLVLAWVMFGLWRGWKFPFRLAGVLCLLSAFALIIGGLRGDFSPMLGGVRVDQWFDLLMITIAVGWWWSWRRSVGYET
jgi:phosphatidylglycerol:prolipoprotein diacylglycerol transferase